jgi:hypothetical protein
LLFFRRRAACASCTLFSILGPVGRLFYLTAISPAPLTTRACFGIVFGAGSGIHCARARVCASSDPAAEMSALCSGKRLFPNYAVHQLLFELSPWTWDMGQTRTQVRKKKKAGGRRGVCCFHAHAANAGAPSSMMLGVSSPSPIKKRTS